MNFDLARFAALPESEQAAVIDSLSEEDFDALVGLKEWYALRKSAESSLLDFTRFTMPHPEHHQDGRKSRYSVAAHHRVLAEALEEVLSGKCMRLAISVPPQHGKSELATRRFLAYHVGRFPWKNLMMGTYNQTFSEEFGEDVRSIINSEEFKLVFPHSKLRTGSKAKDHMVTTDGGKLSFLGRGGSGTGRPADGFLVDDPIKDAKEAESKAIRDDVWNWFTRVGNTRCHKLSWQIVIQTRWSDDDLIARLTDPKNPHYNPDVARQWKVINLPAILDNEELAGILGKKLGDALWEERFPLDLLKTARQMDPYGFSALYMGRPTPPEGAFYKDWMLCTYENPKEFPMRGNFYMSGDLAVSPERDADKSCVGIWGLDEKGDLYLHPELYWDKRASDESVERLIYLGSMFQVSDAWFEKGQLDKAIGPFLDKRHQELVQAGKGVSPDGTPYKPRYFHIQRLPVAGSKGLRSVSVRGLMSQRRVKFPAFAPWWTAAKEQMLKFTGSGNDKEDDFCDMLALIGQAVEDQVKPRHVEDEKVVPFRPTMRWMTASHRAQREAARLRANLRGM